MSDEHAKGEKQKLSEFEARILMSILSMHVSVTELSTEIKKTQGYIAKAIMADNVSDTLSQIHEMLSREDVNLDRTREIINGILEKYEP